MLLPDSLAVNVLIIAGIVCQIQAIPHLFGSEDAENVDSGVTDGRQGDWKAAFKYSPYFSNIWGTTVDVEEDAPAKADRVIILGGSLEPRNIITNPKAVLNPKNHPGPSIASPVTSSTISTPAVPASPTSPITSTNPDESRLPASESTAIQASSSSQPLIPTSSQARHSNSRSASTSKTSTSSAAPSTPTIGHTVSGLKLDGIHTGIGTYFDVGLGSCGITSKNTDYIVAASHLIYDTFPNQYNPANPNDNPICGRKIKASYGGKSVQVVVQDECMGCAAWSLDLSPVAFQKLEKLEVGELQGMTWEFV